MMARDKPPQRSLFYTGINLDKRVRAEHVLRKVAGLVDFDFVYGEVKESYGYNGNVSVAPPTILKLMLLLAGWHLCGRSSRRSVGLKDSALNILSPQVLWIICQSPDMGQGPGLWGLA
jgi:hypothetical protein